MLIHGIDVCFELDELGAGVQAPSISSRSLPPAPRPGRGQEHHACCLGDGEVCCWEGAEPGCRAFAGRCSGAPRWGRSELAARKPAGGWGASPGRTGRGLPGSRSVCHGAGARRAAGKGQRAGYGSRYLLHDVAVAVAGSQVQRGVVTTVHDIDACSPHNKHVDHVGAALTAGPVQGAEAVVIPVGTAGTALLSGCSLPDASSPDPGRESPAEHGDSTAAGQVSPCAPARGPRR